MAVNFVAGMMRGLGAAIGATAVLAVMIWLLAKAVNLPVIGEYFKDAQSEIMALVEEARFTDDFRRVENLLKQIEKNTSTDSVEVTEIVERRVASLKIGNCWHRRIGIGLWNANRSQCEYDSIAIARCNSVDDGSAFRRLY